MCCVVLLGLETELLGFVRVDESSSTTGINFHRDLEKWKEDWNMEQ